MLAREVDPFDAAGGGNHVQAGAFEQARQNATADRAVVDDQRGHFLPGASRA